MIPRPFLCIALASSVLLAGCGGAGNAPVPANETTPPANAPQPAPDQARIDELVRQAGEASAGGDNTAAADLLDAALALDPRSGKAWAWRGKVLAKLGRNAEARDAHRKAAEFAPAADLKQEQLAWAARAALAAGKEAAGRGEHGKARQWYEEGLADAPGDAALRTGLAHALHATGKYDEALALFRALSESSSGTQRQDAVYFSADCLMRLGRCKEAEPLFSSLLAENYITAEVYAFRGFCRNALGNPRGALQDYEQAERLAADTTRRAEYADAVRQLRAALGEGG